MSRSHRAAGLTLVEVTVVVALTVPLLLVLGSASRAVMGSFTATDRASRTTEQVLRAVTTIEGALNFGRRQSLLSQATLDDVRRGRASAVGVWFSLPTGEQRTSLEVQALVGDAGPALVIPSRRHRLLLVPDPGEAADGRDNDGDGLVDERTLVLVRGDETLKLLSDVESCTFELRRQALTVTIRFGRAGHGRALQRATVVHTVLLNNP
jgi:hypothetical protein